MAGYFNLHWLTTPLSPGQMDDLIKANIKTILRNTLHSVINE
jgi:hypothetical protein